MWLEVKTIADKLVNKRLVDIDALMSYLENDTDLGYATMTDSLKEYYDMIAKRS